MLKGTRAAHDNLPGFAPTARTMASQEDRLSPLIEPNGDSVRWKKHQSVPSNPVDLGHVGREGIAGRQSDDRPGIPKSNALPAFIRSICHETDAIQASTGPPTTLWTSEPVLPVLEVSAQSRGRSRDTSQLIVAPRRSSSSAIGCHRRRNLRGGDDSGEVVGFQRRAAHEAAVDVGLGEKLLRVRCAHAPTVENPYSIGRRT